MTTRSVRSAGVLNLAVAITSGGDRWCRAMSRNLRLDLPGVRSFLDDFVPVPKRSRKESR